MFLWSLSCLVVPCLDLALFPVWPSFFYILLLSSSPVALFFCSVPTLSTFLACAHRPSPPIPRSLSPGLGLIQSPRVPSTSESESPSISIIHYPSPVRVLNFSLLLRRRPPCPVCDWIDIALASRRRQSCCRAPLHHHCCDNDNITSISTTNLSSGIDFVSHATRFSPIA